MSPAHQQHGGSNRLLSLLGVLSCPSSATVLSLLWWVETERTNQDLFAL